MDYRRLAERIAHLTRSRARTKVKAEDREAPSPEQRKLLLAAAAATAAALLAASALGAKEVHSSLPVAAVSDMHYDVTFDAATAARGVIRISTSFTVDGAGEVALSLPAWTPGSYELDNFARHVRGFEARTSSGEVRWDKADYDTWRVYPTAGGEVTVSYDYAADDLDVSAAWSTADMAFFNGTNVFLYPETSGYDFPATVGIHTEDDWVVATGLTTNGGSYAYTAADYHELVDMPTMIGRVAIDSRTIDGRTYRLATYPVEALSPTQRSGLWDQIDAMMPPMHAVFGETPWEDYTTMIVFEPSFPGGSALEHRNSHLGVYSPFFIDTPVLASITAHEIFHAWNVKRLRPAELWPYDYDRALPTELLWVSEGITDYYADIALVRGGIVSDRDFYQLTAGKIQTVNNLPPTALEDASLSTWISPDDGTSSIYYPKGSLAGFMLDILIRDRSDNRASLDDVMRTMYEETYKNGRGFTEDEWWETVRDAAGRGTFEDFHDAYIDGRADYPWDEILPLAGLTIETETVSSPFMGISTNGTDDGVQVVSVVPGSAAAAAGVQADDILLEVAGDPVEDLNFGAVFRARLAGAEEGTPYEMVVDRGGQRVTVQSELRYNVTETYGIGELDGASDKATRIREAILRGS